MSRSTHLKVIFIQILILTAINASIQSQAIAVDGAPTPPSCVTTSLKEKLSELKKTFSKKFNAVVPTEAELTRLSGLKMSELFPDVETVRLETGTTFERTKLSDEQVAAFNQAWDDLRYQRIEQSALHAKDLDLAIAKSGGKNGHLNLTAEIVDDYKRKGLTLLEIQELTVKTYNYQRILKHGDIYGWKKFIAHESPYFLAKLAVGGTKTLLKKTIEAIPVGLPGALALALYKPFVDQYSKGVKQVQNKAIDQLPENKAYAESIAENEKIEKATTAFDYSQLQTKEDRIKKWQEIEAQFKQSHETIRERRANVRVLAAESEQTKKITTPYLRANRITYLTSLRELAKDKSKDSLPDKALALANFKAQDMKMPPTALETTMTQPIADKILEQLAGDPVSFQQFITEFVSMQAESAPQN